MIQNFKQQLLNYNFLFKEKLLLHYKISFLIKKIADNFKIPHQLMNIENMKSGTQ